MVIMLSFVIPAGIVSKSKSIPSKLYFSKNAAIFSPSFLKSVLGVGLKVLFWPPKDTSAKPFLFLLLAWISCVSDVRKLSGSDKDPLLTCSPLIFAKEKTITLYPLFNAF